eukprot:90150-Chlamydomonas_euryale.AAC.1
MRSEAADGANADRRSLGGDPYHAQSAHVTRRIVTHTQAPAHTYSPWPVGTCWGPCSRRCSSTWRSAQAQQGRGMSVERPKHKQERGPSWAFTVPPQSRGV